MKPFRRFAQAGDMPRLLEMGREFMDAVAPPFPFDADGFERQMGFLLPKPEVLVRVIDDGAGRAVGMFAAVLAPHFLMLEPKTAGELFWWVSPEHRRSRHSLGLLADYEAWAAERGARVASVSVFAHDARRLMAVLERRGYRHYESTFIRTLGAA